MKKLCILLLFISTPAYADVYGLVLPERKPETVIIVKKKIIQKQEKLVLARPNKLVSERRRYISAKTLNNLGGNVTVSYRNKTIKYRNNPPWQ